MTQRFHFECLVDWIRAGGWKNVGVVGAGSVELTYKLQEAKVRALPCRMVTSLFDLVLVLPDENGTHSIVGNTAVQDVISLELVPDPTPP